MLEGRPTPGRPAGTAVVSVQWPGAAAPEAQVAAGQVQVLGPPAGPGPTAKMGFGRKPALYPARAESRLFDLALKLSKCYMDSRIPVSALAQISF